jgi:hypothetical protein
MEGSPQAAVVAAGRLRTALNQEMEEVVGMEWQ